MPKKPMLIEKHIEIKAYDIDVIGIVSNIVYVRWFEDLRHSFLDKYYPYKQMIEAKNHLFLLKQRLNTKLP